jgi:hypothetical protein
MNSIEIETTNLVMADKKDLDIRGVQVFFVCLEHLPKGAKVTHFYDYPHFCKSLISAIMLC